MQPRACARDKRMIWFPLLLFLTIVLAALFAIVGRIAASALRIDALDGDQPEHWLAAMLFGTGLVTLICGWCAYAGLSAREYRWIVLGVLTGLLGVAVVRGDARRLVRFAALARGHLIVGSILAIRVGLYLLPVLFGGSHLLISDAMTYVPAADWLGNNGFRASLQPNPEQPIQSLMILFQQMNHRMGPMFLHSFLAVSIPEVGAFELFPVMIGLGLILNLGTVYLICRWCFNVSERMSFAGLLLVAILAHSLASSSTGTFLCQLYGTAVLGTAIAFMVILSDPLRWTHGNALLVGFLVSIQLSMYSELAPVLAIAGTAWLSINAIQSFRFRSAIRFGCFLAFIALFTLSIANVEIVRCWNGVLNMLKLNGVGTHIQWSWPGFVEFAIGGSGYDHRFGFTFRVFKRAACSGVVAILLLGGLRFLFRQGGSYVAVSLAVLAALFAYYATSRTDPWTGATGHTWNLFKASKWAYPFVAAVQVAGLAWIGQYVVRKRYSIGIALVLLGTVALFNVQQHVRVARAIAKQTREISGGDSPYSAARQLRCRLAESTAPIYLVRTPETDFKGPLQAGLFYPRPLLNGWPGDPLYGTLGLLDDRPRAFDADTVFMLFGEPPFDEPLERLPFRMSRLDPDQPVLFRIDYPDRPYVPRAGEPLVVGDKPITCWIFAARGGTVELASDHASEWNRPNRVLTISINSAAPVEWNTGHGLPIKKGINRVTLSAGDTEIRLWHLKVRWRTP
jgi:hypothetical protein